MKKKINVILIIMVAIFVGLLNVKAHEVKKIEAGETFCIEKHPNFSKYYAYSWRQGYTNDTWPGIEMKVDPNNSNVYCFVDTADAVTYEHDRIIFNNQGQPQTIDLNTVGGGLVYVIESTSGNYQGSWYVYDRSPLINLVSKTQNLNEEDYTIASYQKLLNVLNGDNNTIGAKELATKTYKDFPTNPEDKEINPFLLKSRNGRDGFDSQYEAVYNALVAAEQTMVKRKKVVIASVEGGAVTSSYAENSDSVVKLTSNPNLGNKLNKLKVTEITGYDNQGNPILGASLPNISIDSMEYTLTTSDVYIEPVFGKMEYKLSFVVGENGKVYYENDKEVGAPITVYYNDNYTLKIVANEGYEIGTIVVNGSTYELKDGQLTIKNVVQDTGVEISFKLIDYIIKIDGKEYKVSHGTTYEQLLRLINIDKEGYSFKGLKDMDENTLSETYVVKGDDELTSIFEKNPEKESESNNEVSKNPNTGDNIAKYLILFSLSIIGLVVLLVKKSKRTQL